MFFSQSAASHKDAKYTSSAKVIDGILVLSLPDAVTPVVWQMELGQSKSSALEIRDGENGLFVLTLKTPRQDVLEIAKYDTREGAVRALMTVSEAMEKAQGQLRLSRIASYTERNGSHDYPVPALYLQARAGMAKSLLKMFGLIALAVVVIFVLLLSASVLISAFSGAGESSSLSPATTQNTPVSAEDFLEGR